MSRSQLFLSHHLQRMA